MDKEELIQFLKENMELELEYDKGNYYRPKNIRLVIYLDGEEIASTTEYVYD